MIQSIGLALSFGVLVDAFLVRMTFVPAVLALLAKRAWKFPRFLDRVLPNVDIEGNSIKSPAISNEAVRARVYEVPADERAAPLPYPACPGGLAALLRACTPMTLAAVSGALACRSRF